LRLPYYKQFKEISIHHLAIFLTVPNASFHPTFDAGVTILTIDAKTLKPDRIGTFPGWNDLKFGSYNCFILNFDIIVILLTKPHRSLPGFLTYTEFARIAG
jgi:hypothetical protein